MSNYILTFDYELFGSGRGCVFKHLVNPTQRILEKLKYYDVKATFFIEVLEVQAILNLKNTYSQGTYEYKAAVALEHQLIAMINGGHDLQLHLHPQWYGAKYKDGTWKLNFDWWCFSSLPYKTSKDKPGKLDLLKAGKNWLEKLVQSYRKDYICTSFRAGGYNIGNDVSSAKALIASKLKLDSSVCPGFYASTGLSTYDFSSIESANPYFFSQSVLNPELKSNSVEQIIELPLITINSPKSYKLSFARVYNAVVNRKFKSLPVSVNVMRKEIKNINNITTTNFDICLASRNEISKFLQSSEKVPYVVLIGHPKDYSIFSPLSKLLRETKREFITVEQFIVATDTDVII